MLGSILLSLLENEAKAKPLFSNQPLTSVEYHQVTHESIDQMENSEIAHEEIENWDDDNDFDYGCPPRYF